MGQLHLMNKVHFTGKNKDTYSMAVASWSGFGPTTFSQTDVHMNTRELVRIRTSKLSHGLAPHVYMVHIVDSRDKGA